MEKIGFSAPYFTDEEKAREYLEKLRWPDVVVCPHCGSREAHYRLQGDAHRKGLWKCQECRKQFSVTVGTVFERSHIPLHKWLLATYLLCSSKKGMSSHQLHRTLGVTYKSAWFMAHRIRFAMRQRPTRLLEGIIEADETYVGGKVRGGGTGRGTDNKTPVFALVERNGKVRSMPVKRVDSVNLKQIIRENVDKSAKIMTDEFGSYNGLGCEFASHETVCHSAKEYARGDVHTNTVEGYFSLLKRGIIGVYHHVDSNHLHRYLAEFDMRYNYRHENDATRTVAALKGIEGRRLTYKD
ncbi:MAG TPA: IS1595 family transposase [Syntrophorhabdaceae bacterium]|nr:IS1595 family transposase [Syntrophorhabdaceae bacterium]